MSSLEEDAVGDVDDEVKDYSKLYKDHQEKEDDMLDDRMDTVQVYNEEGTPMISLGNTPMIFSRTSSPDSLHSDSLHSDCEGDGGNRDNGNSSSSRVSESSIGRILGTVSPSDLPASPGDLFNEHEPEEENNNGNSGRNQVQDSSNQVQDSSNHVQDNGNHVQDSGNHVQDSGNRLNDKRPEGIRFQPMPSPRKTIIGSSVSRKPLPSIPSRGWKSSLESLPSLPSIPSRGWKSSLESPPPLPSSSPPLLSSPVKFTSPPSISSPPPVPNRPRPGRPPVPPKPAHLKQNTSGNRSCELKGEDETGECGRRDDDSYRINSSSSDSDDDDDDDDDLLADVIYAGIPKRRNKKEDTVVQKDGASSCDHKNDRKSDHKSDRKSDHKSDLMSERENGHLSVQEFKTDYLETDIDTVINYDKFLMNQKPSIFHYKSYQV